MCVWHVEQVRVGLRKDKSLPSIVERQYISEWEKKSRNYRISILFRKIELIQREKRGH